MNRVLLRIAIVIALVGSALVAVPRPASALPATWWDSSYSHRLNIGVQAQDALVTGYQVAVTIDHASMVAAGNSLASGNDVRIVHWNGTSWDGEQDRVTAVGSAWNTSTTKLYFKTVAAVSANTTDTNYWLYFGNNAPAAPLANANSVYDLFDDFSSGVIDSSKWNTSLSGDSNATATVAGGRAVLTSSSTAANYPSYELRSVASFPASEIEEGTVTITSSQAYYNYWMGPVLATWDAAGFTAPGGDIGVYSSGWKYFGAGALTGTSTGARWGSALKNGYQAFYQNGTYMGSRPNAPVNGSNYATFDFQMNAAAAAKSFTMTIDDVVVRKFTQYQPTVFIEQYNDIPLAVGVAPVFSFTLSGTSSACNGVTPTATATATAIPLGRTAASAISGAQNLMVNSNAGGGYVVFEKGTALTGPKTISSVSGTNAAPDIFGTGERFGYTSGDADLTRFSGTKWAAMNTTNAAVATAINTPVVADATCVLYQFVPAANTPAGSYATSVTYTAVPTF